MQQPVSVPSSFSGGGNRPSLRADCESCFGLCCAALAFTASADFPMDKAAGQACPNLQADFRCGIHCHLRKKGFRGCTVYDCFGAGQKLSQHTFGGEDWRRFPETRERMFRAFPVMMQLHELLWHLAEALAYPEAAPLHNELAAMQTETEAMTGLPPDSLIKLDMPAHWEKTGELLRQTSGLVRQQALQKLKAPPNRRSTKPGSASRPNTDLFGARLRGKDMRGESLRGACLIAADLSQADLRWADLAGADCRDTNFREANLTDCLFLTQAQLESAKGDRRTLLPKGLLRPAHWDGS